MVQRPLNLKTIILTSRKESHNGNEILNALNKPEQFILAVVKVDGEKAARTTYIMKHFGREPDFSVTTVNYKIADLLAKGGCRSELGTTKN